MIEAIVLAAGESKHLGKPKPLLPFGDETFLEQIVSVLGDTYVDRTIVVLGAEAEAIQEAIDLSGVKVVVDEQYHTGRWSSLVAGLKRVSAKTEAIVLCLGANPFITAEMVDRVIDTHNETGSPIVIPTFRGKRGHPSLFARSLFAELKNAPLDQGPRHVVSANPECVVEIEIADRAVVTSVNTPGDYRKQFGVDP